MGFWGFGAQELAHSRDHFFRFLHRLRRISDVINFNHMQSGLGTLKFPSAAAIIGEEAVVVLESGDRLSEERV